MDIDIIKEVEEIYGCRRFIVTLRSTIVHTRVYHRIDGPACEWKDGKKVWWLYGKCYKESEYNHLVSNLPLLYWERFKEGKWI